MSQANVIEESTGGRQFLDTESFRRFSEPALGRWISTVTLEWTIIGSTMVVCNLWPYAWLWALGVIIIGTRQHALGIMAHEGVHYNVARNKFWNDLLANWLAAYSLTYPVEGYRTNHLIHHRYLDTPEDPERAGIDNYPEDWTYPMPRRRFFIMLARDVLGIYQIQTPKLYKYIWVIQGKKLPHILKIVLFHGAIITAAVMTGFFWTYILLWLLPLFTIALLCFRLRTAAEHSGLYRPEKRYNRLQVDTLATTRTTFGCPITQFLLAPYNMSYHIEHHLYPSVPVFRLKALHKELMRKPAYFVRARVTRSFRQLVRELTTT
jgi:fatty acid desaturase